MPRSSRALEVAPELQETRSEPSSDAEVLVLDEPSVAVTLFESHLATEGLELELELSELADRVSQPERDAPALFAPPTWSFASYAGGQRDQPVESLSGLVLEYDAADVTEDSLRRSWARWCFVAYSDPALSRWLLVLPLAEAVSPEHYGELLDWARRRFPEASPTERCGDLKTLWPVPIAGGIYRCVIHIGAEPLDPEEALEALRAEDARQQAISQLSRALSGAPSLRQVFHDARLARSQRRRPISMAALPGWPQGPLSGYGWGAVLDEHIGGLRPGLVLAITAEGAVIAGRDPATALALQLADGLALRSAAVAGARAADVLSPVMLLTELQPEQLALRSLARWIGADRRVLEAGASARAAAGETDTAAIFQAARGALRGHLTRAWDYVRVLDGALRGPERLEALRSKLDTWQQLLEQQHSQEVWPVVVVSPAVAMAPGELDALLAISRSRGWALIVAGAPEDIPEQRADARLRLQQRAVAGGGEVVAVEARVVGGWTPSPSARFHWLTQSGRVFPVTQHGVDVAGAVRQAAAAARAAAARAAAARAAAARPAAARAAAARPAAARAAAQQAAKREGAAAAARRDEAAAAATREGAAAKAGSAVSAGAAPPTRSAEGPPQRAATERAAGRSAGEDPGAQSPAKQVAAARSAGEESGGRSAAKRPAAARARASSTRRSKKRARACKASKSARKPPEIAPEPLSLAADEAVTEPMTNARAIATAEAMLRSPRSLLRQSLRGLDGGDSTTLQRLPSGTSLSSSARPEGRGGGAVLQLVKGEEG